MNLNLEKELRSLFLFLYNKVMAKSVLFIEDNPQTQNLYSKLMTMEKFNVDTASDGLSAYELLEEKKYDLILVDLMMSGMDGLAFLEAIKKKKVGSKIVIFSNVSPDNVLSKIHGIVISDYIVKSDIRPDLFMERINKLLN